MVDQWPKALVATFAVFVLLTVSHLQVSAFSDENPNSPTPILITEPNTKRALAVPASRFNAEDPTAGSEQIFQAGSDVYLFIYNVELMKGEGANAFRLNVQDAKGRNYRFNVTDLVPVSIKGYPEAYAIKVRLRDTMGFWAEPIDNADVAVSVAWRGLASEKRLLGHGNTGGPIGDLLEKHIAKTKVPEIDGSNIVSARWSGDRMRFLQQAGFGANAALDTRVRRIGVRTYLAEQLDAPYPSADFPYPDIPLKSTDSSNVTIGCGMFPDGTLERRICNRDHYSMYPVQKWLFSEALYGPSQLRHKVSWALSQIWVISGSGGVTQQSSWMIAYHKKLSENAFGNYRQLMRDITLNPGMGNYLDMARSTRNNPNENYPREILQLFSVGLFRMNQDGTLICVENNPCQPGDTPVPTYDQATVDNFTKVFTGWTFCNVGCPNSLPSIVNYKDPMVVVTPNNHDITAKTLMNYDGAPNATIPACTGCTGETTRTYAQASLEQALDNIFYHPNVAPFVSKLMIQHLVTSDPSPAYVGRVAAVFNNNGGGVRGDMRAVVRAILLDPEARGDVKTDPNFGKLREPVQLATNILKALNVKNAALTGPSDGVLTNYTNGIGQNPFNSPTVFNYFPPDYTIPGTSLLGPEFGIMTTGTSIGRANVVNTMTYGQINAGENTPGGTRIDLTDLQALMVADPTGNLVLDELNHRMLHNTMSPEMRAIILPAIAAVGAADTLGRARAAVYLVATSSQFQIQR